MVYTVYNIEFISLPILHMFDWFTSSPLLHPAFAYSIDPRSTSNLLRVRYRHTHEPSSVLRLEAQVLSLEMSGLGVLGNLSHGVLSPLVGWQGIVNRLSVFGSNSILLSEISLLDDRVGKLLVRII